MRAHEACLARRAGRPPRHVHRLRHGRRAAQRWWGPTEQRWRWRRGVDIEREQTIGPRSIKSSLVAATERPNRLAIHGKRAGLGIFNLEHAVITQNNST